jgi:hypothetical protein
MSQLHGVETIELTSGIGAHIHNVVLGSHNHIITQLRLTLRVIQKTP